METYVMQEWPLFVGIISIMIVSIICQFIVICYMAKMVKESESLEERPQTLGRWLEEYYQNKQKITNIPVFVDKKIQQISIGKFSIIGIKESR